MSSACVVQRWVRKGEAVAVVVCCLAFLLVVPAAAQETTPCETALRQSETSYIEGRFQQAISLLSPCLDGPEVEKSERVRAHRLLALALLRSDELAEARAAIVSLLSIAPDYRPDPVEDPPSYSALVNVVREQVHVDSLAQREEPQVAANEQETERSRWRANLKWVVSGGVVVAAGLLAAVLRGGGSDGPEPLPPPPSLPN